MFSFRSISHKNLEKGVVVEIEQLPKVYILIVNVTLEVIPYNSFSGLGNNMSVITLASLLHNSAILLRKTPSFI